jgi:heme-degrading monooxygenase HmoA
MYARRVSIQLKPNSSAEYTQKFERDVLPLLRKSKGFQDEITFVAPSGAKAFAISLWDRMDSAEAYSRDTYPQIAKILEKVTEGTPQIENFEVGNSTFHKIAATVPA